MKINILFSLSILLFLVACGQSNRKVTDNSKTATDYAKQVNLSDDLAIATFAGGCFWCTEASFDQLKGVQEVISGYSGGKEENPTYKQVSYGKTTHAEAINVYYDSEIITYQNLLDVFFVAHDPTQLNRQGNDVGPQYRSAIYYRTSEEKLAVDNTIKKLADAGKFSQPIVTEVVEFSKFWDAEDYHQDYYKKNPNDRYMLGVGVPKIKKVQKYFPEWIR